MVEERTFSSKNPYSKKNSDSFPLIIAIFDQIQEKNKPLNVFIITKTINEDGFKFQGKIFASKLPKFSYRQISGFKICLYLGINEIFFNSWELISIMVTR